MSIISNPHVLVILVYLLALVGVGVYKTRAVKGSADFMVAGRALPWFVLVGTLLATWMGNGSLFGGAGLGYRNGLAGLWSSGGGWLGILLVFFIARRIRNFGKITIPDIFEARYGRVAALLATITTVIAYLTIVSYQFKGGGRVLSIVTGGEITPETGILITAIFAITYTVLAGMLSVVYTDVVNGALMTIGVLVGLGYLLIRVGGIGEVVAAADAAGNWSWFGHWHLEKGGGAPGPVIAIAFFVPTLLLLMGDANMYQRIFSARDAGTARKAVFFWIIGVVVLESSIAMFGLTGSVAANQGIISDLGAAGVAATETIIPTVALEALPLLLGMLLVATMMAMIVSTADSFLLVPATNLTRDIFQRYLAPDASERTVVVTGRILVLALGIVALLLVGQFPTILEAAYTAYLIYGTSITPALLAAFLWKRATRQGAVTSIAIGALVTLVWTFFLPQWEGLGFENWSPFLREVTYPAAGFSLAALVLVSLATPAPPRSVWERFFNEDRGRSRGGR